MINPVFLYLQYPTIYLMIKPIFSYLSPELPTMYHLWNFITDIYNVVILFTELYFWVLVKTILMYTLFSVVAWKRNKKILQYNCNGGDWKVFWRYQQKIQSLHVRVGPKTSSQASKLCYSETPTHPLTGVKCSYVRACMRARLIFFQFVLFNWHSVS